MTFNGVGNNWHRQPPPPPPPPPHLQRPPLHQVMGDLNNDHKLDDAEKSRMQSIDTNRNGRIDPNEHFRELQMYDSDRNGLISKSEFENQWVNGSDSSTDTANSTDSTSTETNNTTQQNYTPPPPPPPPPFPPGAGQNGFMPPPPPPPPGAGQNNPWQPGQYQSPFQQKPPLHLVMGDLNGDHKLDQYEKSRMQVVDTNEDGRIDPNEHYQEMQMHDLNKDNRLSPFEFRKAYIQGT